ncbi:hypothetical protein BG011_004559 [Mortierella polycephala]|uniref:Uncharacterized protein n=1 Tax=Mortierella polycephala TaxID=41804 RepID=A0A9P6U9P8_9FUNG|nr:hypothetical protein BG011_004559 [Mortierella polycephala]
MHSTHAHNSLPPTETTLSSPAAGSQDTAIDTNEEQQQLVLQQTLRDESELSTLTIPPETKSIYIPNTPFGQPEGDGDHTHHPLSPNASSDISKNDTISQQYTPTTPTTPTPPRTRSSVSINTNAKGLAIKNAVAGGLMSSPTAMPTAAYATFPRRQSERSSVSVPSVQITTHDAQHKDIPSTFRNKGTMRPDLRFYQNSIGSMDVAPPMRSMSYSRPTIPPNSHITSSAYFDNANAPPEGSINRQSCQHQQHQYRHHSITLGALHRSPSLNKDSKKGLTTRLNALRQRRESRESSSSVSSSESESEIAIESLSSGRGHAHRPTFNLSSSKQKSNSMGAIRPSLPRIRSEAGSRRESPISSIPTYAIPYGFGRMGAAPLSVVTARSANHLDTSGTPQGCNASATPPNGELSKESSTMRFKEMVKRNVGLSTPGSAGPLSINTVSSSSSASKLSPQPRSSAADLISGDEQPSLFSVSRIAGRKKHAVRRMKADNAPAQSEDEGQPFDKRENPHHHHHHHLLSRLRRRRHRRHLRALTDWVELSKEEHEQPIAPPVSAAVQELRQSNPDPNILYAEVEPLPASFAAIFATRTESPRESPRPLASAYSASTTSTPASTLSKQYLLTQLPMAGSIILSSTIRAKSGSISASTLTSQAPPPIHIPLMNHSARDPLSARNFLFKSYQNSKFQAHYAFRIHEGQVEYCRLPLAMEQACSLYFREADVTYRSLEKKAKQWKKERNAAMNSRVQEFQDARVGYIRSRLSMDSTSTLRSPDDSMDESNSSTGADTDDYSVCSDNNDDSDMAGEDVTEPETLQPTVMNIQEQEQLEQMQRAIDDAYWEEVERDHCKESKEATYGLELFLTALIQRVEYERFDAVSQIEITNDNRDSALFSMINGDRTNVMFLESPSLKLKYEFMSWIYISRMDHGEPDQQSDSDSETRFSATRRGFTLECSKDQYTLDVNASENKDADLLLKIADVRLSLLEAKIQSKQEQATEFMKQMESTLERLDELDDKAKGLATRVTRAIEGRELRTALQPSPTTGLTLAETVNCKIKDVNDRIVNCARVMGAARHNLNRLKYEVELEQRSIRLFRQYKIAILIVTISILGLVWFLYHRHRVAASTIYTVLDSSLESTCANGVANEASSPMAAGVGAGMIEAGSAMSETIYPCCLVAQNPLERTLTMPDFRFDMTRQHCVNYDVDVLYMVVVTTMDLI